MMGGEWRGESGGRRVRVEVGGKEWDWMRSSCVFKFLR